MPLTDEDLPEESSGLSPYNDEAYEPLAARHRGLPDDIADGASLTLTAEGHLQTTDGNYIVGQDGYTRVEVDPDAETLETPIEPQEVHRDGNSTELADGNGKVEHREPPPFIQYFGKTLPITDEKELVRGPCGTPWWVVPAEALDAELRGAGTTKQKLKERPWAKEINYVMTLRGNEFLKTFGYDGLAFEDAKEDLIGSMTLDLLTRENKGDYLPHFTESSVNSNNIHPNVVQVCLHHIEDLRRAYTVESELKRNADLPPVIRELNKDYPEPGSLDKNGVPYPIDLYGDTVALDDNGERIPKYTYRHLYEYLDAPNSSGSGHRSETYDDENSEETQLCVEGAEVSLTGASSLTKDGSVSAEDQIIEMLEQGRNESILRRAMSKLKAQELFVIRAMFGFDTPELPIDRANALEPLRHKQIARILSISVPGVDKIRKRSLEFLNKEITREQLSISFSKTNKVRLPNTFAGELESKAWRGNEHLHIWLESFQKLFMTDSDLQKQIALRQRFSKGAQRIAGQDESGAWMEPRTLICDSESLPTPGPLAWRRCGNPDCDYRVIMAGRRKPIHLGDESRWNADGSQRDCPLCKALGQNCPLCITEQKLTSFCDFCFEEALPTEWSHRREKRIQPVPSLDSRPMWLIDLTDSGVIWQDIVIDYSPIGVYDGRVVLSPSAKWRPDLSPCPITSLNVHAIGCSSRDGIIVVLHDRNSRFMGTESVTATNSFQPLHVQKTPAYISEMRARGRRPAILSNEDAIDRRKRAGQMKLDAAKMEFQNFRNRSSQRGTTSAELSTRFEEKHPRAAQLLQYNVCRRCGAFVAKPKHACVVCVVAEPKHKLVDEPTALLA